MAALLVQGSFYVVFLRLKDFSGEECAESATVSGLYNYATSDKNGEEEK